MEPGQIEPVLKLVLVKLQHRNVDVAVRQHHTPSTWIVDSPHLLEAEDILIELGLFLGIQAGNRKVLNSPHVQTPQCCGFKLDLLIDDRRRLAIFLLKPTH